MLFRRDIEPRCGYCRFSAPAGNDLVICRKRGIKEDSDACPKFKYNPLRRTPPKPASIDFSKYDEQDYSL